MGFPVIEVIRQGFPYRFHPVKGGVCSSWLPVSENNGLATGPTKADLAPGGGSWRNCWVYPN